MSRGPFNPATERRRMARRKLAGLCRQCGKVRVIRFARCLVCRIYQATWQAHARKAVTM